MRTLAALLVALSLPAVAGEAPPRPAKRAKKAAPAEKKPWEMLLESSRAALDASRGKQEPAQPPLAPLQPALPQLALPAAQPELALPVPPAPQPVARPAIATTAGTDDAPDLVQRAPRRVLVPSPPDAAAPLIAEPSAAPLAAGSELDFNLLETAPAPTLQLSTPGLEQSLGLRRTMLTVHQTVGIGLVGLMATTMITGQLNYLDRFGGPSTARYEGSHKFFATTTLATFAGAGLLAFFAPVPLERRSEGIDRAFVHKAGMIGATVGMIAEGTLGILTVHQEGYADQATLARAHLAIGYLTLACMAVGVGALVF